MNQPLTLVPRSSLGSKFLMAVTGLGLTGFVVVHMLGNLQIFLGREHLNAYAKALQGNAALLWTARLVLLAIFLAHIIYGIRLWLANRAARPVPYYSRRYREASVASRTMLLTGLVILAFVVFHVLHFTVGVIDRGPKGSYLELQDPKGQHDVYAMVVYGFRNPLVSMVYVVAMALLCLHISHGFGSLWQSIGWNDRRWASWLKRASQTLALVLFVGNSSMPLAVLFGLIGRNVP